MLVSEVYLFKSPKGHILWTYTVTCLGLIIVQISYMTYISELILILVSDLYLFRSPIGVTEPMLIHKYLIRYGYLYLSQISHRSLQNLYLFYRVYTCSEIPEGITEISERILDLRNLILYGSTRKYYLIKCLF